jgi:methylated-DNA-protein-cysteine methyltransferase-like protein
MASSEMAEHVEQLYRAIYAVIREIPRGRVATYGQIAELAGLPGGARVAGAALKTCKPGHRLPWQRVIGKAGRNRGRIAIHDPVGAAVQRQLLGDEGVAIGDTGLIALDVYGWLPGPGRAPRGRARSGTRAAADRARGKDRATAKAAPPRTPASRRSKRAGRGTPRSRSRARR